MPLTAKQPHSPNFVRSRIVHRIDRYYHVQKVKLVTARTGQVIEAKTFSGAAPRSCKETEYLDPDETTSTLEGSPVSATVVQRWLEPHLIIT